MSRQELLRWTGSIGIFYALIPAYLIASDRFLQTVMPWPAPRVTHELLVPVYGVLGLLGAALAWVSMRAQVRRGRGHPFDMTGRESFSRPTQRLLSDGVYTICRNPMGLGDVLFYAGLCGLTASGWSLVIQVPAYAILVVWNHRVNERPALMKRFGDDYRAYERQTPLLIPTPASLKRALRAPRAGELRRQRGAR